MYEFVTNRSVGSIPAATRVQVMHYPGEGPLSDIIDDMGHTGPVNIRYLRPGQFDLDYKDEHGFKRSIYIGLGDIILYDGNNFASTSDQGAISHKPIKPTTTYTVGDLGANDIGLTRIRLEVPGSDSVISGILDSLDIGEDYTRRTLAGLEYTVQLSVGSVTVSNLPRSTPVEITRLAPQNTA